MNTGKQREGGSGGRGVIQFDVNALKPLVVEFLTIFKTSACCQEKEALYILMLKALHPHLVLLSQVLLTKYNVYSVDNSWS